MWEFRSRDRDEIIAFHEEHYGKLDFSFLRKADNFQACYTGYELDSMTRFRETTSHGFIVSCKEERDGFLVSSYHHGNVKLQHGGQTNECKAGNSSISPLNLPYRHECQALDNTMTVIASEAVNDVCTRLLGAVPDHPVEFKGITLSPGLHSSLETMFSMIDGMIYDENHNSSLVESMLANAIMLLLLRHENNYSPYLQKARSISIKKLDRVREFIKNNSHEIISPIQLAKLIDCSFLDLQKSFRENFGTDLREFINNERKSFLDRSHSYPPDLQYFKKSAILRWNGQKDIESHHTPLTPRYGVSGLSKQNTQKIRCYINDNLSSRISVESMAGHLGLGRKSFSDQFKKSFGVPPKQYLIMERLKLAHWLIVNTADPLAFIALDTGFASQAHLTNSLREYSGLTPGVIRRRS